MAKKNKSHKKPVIVIVGAALAGPTAAARAREINEDAEIILLERNKRVSYSMAGLALHLSGEVKSLDDLNRERENFFRDVYNVDVRIHTEVDEINPRKKTLRVTTSGNTETIRYDKLIFAAGAASIKPIGIKPAKNFYYFRTLDDLAAIRGALDSGFKRFVVLGGGSMGAEALDGLVRAGAQVTLVEKKQRFLPEYSAEISSQAVLSLGQKATILTGIKTVDFTYTNDRVAAVVADGKKIETDFVISAIGVKPRTELLKKAGIKLYADASIRIDDRCRTSEPDIYACSICVSVPQGKDHQWIPQAAVSDKTAQVAGENAAGGSARLTALTGSQIIRLPDIEIGRVGPTLRQAQRRYGKSNLNCVLVHARDTESYISDSTTMTVKMFFTKKKGQLVALEAVGKNIKSRIDVAAAAIAGKLKLQEIAMLDLAYTPVVGTARDAINIAATVGSQLIEGITDLTDFAQIKAQRKKYFVLDVSTQATHAGFHDLHIPLEKLRSEINDVRARFKKSKSKQIATLSQTGRRGHLALRILKAAGLPVVNISGGKQQA
jgi:NADPH-dependent 2,4-dienoyl-CoA reductase/sulfur reductase-like enzyme/rhodanese-related sulfurtransferase